MISVAATPPLLAINNSSFCFLNYSGVLFFSGDLVSLLPLSLFLSRLLFVPGGRVAIDGSTHSSCTGQSRSRGAVDVDPGRNETVEMELEIFFYRSGRGGFPSAP